MDQPLQKNHQAVASKRSVISMAAGSQSPFPNVAITISLQAQYEALCILPISCAAVALSYRL
jgi:hypothetical protein